MSRFGALTRPINGGKIRIIIEERTLADRLIWVVACLIWSKGGMGAAVKQMGAAVKQVVVPLAHGFEEIEAVTVVDILRRAGISVTLAGVETGAPPYAIEGRTGIKLVPDLSLDDVSASDFDMVVLPGGLRGAQTLQDDPRVARLLRSLQDSGRYIAAICAAPTVLAAHGMIAGRKLTSHPSVKDQLSGELYDEGRVVIDGKLVTSRGPGTAMEFAMVLVEILMGHQKAEEVNQGVLAKG